MRAVGRFLVRGTRRAALTLIGFSLVAIGLAGLVLPVLPGWLLIIAGFVVLSREYSWAHSGLAFARKHAARSGRKLRSLATRRRGQAADVGEPSGEVVIDLTGVPDDTEEANFATGSP
ncbi:MAG: PGPGW domain-containing protein [Acidimicrobiia bacterium]